MVSEEMTLILKLGPQFMHLSNGAFECMYVWRDRISSILLNHFQYTFADTEHPLIFFSTFPF